MRKMTAVVTLAAMLLAARAAHAEHGKSLAERIEALKKAGADIDGMMRESWEATSAGERANTEYEALPPSP